MIYTLMSSEVHRILTIEPERSAVGEQDRRKRLADTIFPQHMHPALTRRLGVLVPLVDPLASVVFGLGDAAVR
jgi:hypothetical protein